MRRRGKNEIKGWASLLFFFFFNFPGASSDGLPRFKAGSGMWENPFYFLFFLWLGALNLIYFNLQKVEMSYMIGFLV